MISIIYHVYVCVPGVGCRPAEYGPEHHPQRVHRHVVSLPLRQQEGHVSGATQSHKQYKTGADLGGPKTAADAPKLPRGQL